MGNLNEEKCTGCIIRQIGCLNEEEWTGCSIR